MARLRTVAAVRSTACRPLLAMGLALSLGACAGAGLPSTSALDKPGGTRIDMGIRTGSTLPAAQRLTVKLGIVGPVTADARHPLASGRPRPSGLDVVAETTRIPMHAKTTGFVYGVKVVDKEAPRYPAARHEANMRFARNVLDAAAAKTGQRPLLADEAQWSKEEREKVDRLLTTGYFNLKIDSRPVDGIKLTYVVHVPNGKGQPYKADLSLDTGGSLMMYNFDPIDEPGPRVLEVYADGTLLRRIEYAIVPAEGDKTKLPFAHCAGLIGNPKLADCKPRL